VGRKARRIARRSRIPALRVEILKLMSLLLFGTDFMRPYTSDQEEIANSPQWMPSSLDFRQTATNSGGGTGVAGFDEFLKAIAATRSNSIDSLGLIGHANQKVLAFGGTMQKDGSITAASNQQISEANLDAAIKASTIQPLRNRFKRTDNTTPTIILFGCHSGADDDLLIALRDAFNVGSCQGFKSELEWCIRHQGGRVIDRGRVRVKSGLRPPNGCVGFPTDVWRLQPDKWK
jgi:hypothetical protein